MQGFFPDMTEEQANRISMLGLAHVGDGVYELLTRSMLCQLGHTSVAELHTLTVKQVNAGAQAKAAAAILPMLSEAELRLYKRGRNAKVNSVPHNAHLGDYHSATALEALFGWLYLQGRIDRVNQLFARIAEEMRDAT